MATKKEIRSDNTYIISTDKTDNPKLGAKVLANGRDSLFLDYYFGYSIERDKVSGKTITKKGRKRESLKLYLWQAPRTPLERQYNKETLALAKKIRFEKAQELLENKEGYRIKKKKESVNLLDFFQVFADKANVADRLVLVGALKNFRDFLSIKYPHFSNKITANNIDKEMIKKFVDYLIDNHKGQGAETYYRRFKRMINYAVEKEVMPKNPCRGITTPKVDDVLAKDILSQEELKQLFATHYYGENPEIRRAFAMTCLTGIRYCDIKVLSYSNIDYSNRILKFRQSKTQKHSSSSGVTIPLNDSLMAIIGKKEKNAKDDLIFHLPSNTMCLKALRSWTKKAGIDKHITWHCGRHSFATNLLSNGANIKVVSSLLGHSTLKFTEIYVRAVDKLKEEAINSLPELNI